MNLPIRIVTYHPAWNGRGYWSRFLPRISCPPLKVYSALAHKKGQPLFTLRVALFVVTDTPADANALAGS